MPTIDQIRSGAFKAVGTAPDFKTSNTPNSSGNRNLDMIRAGAFEAVKPNKQLTPAYKAPEMIQPVTPKKPSLLERTKSFFLNAFKTPEGGFKDPTDSGLNNILADKRSKFQLEQSSGNPKKKNLDNLGKDIKEIEEALSSGNVGKKMITLHNLSNERDAGNIKGALVGLAKNVFDGVAQLYQVKWDGAQRQANEQEKFMKEGFDKLGIPETERQALLEKYSSRYNKSLPTSFEPTLKQIEDQSKKDKDLGKVHFQQVMEKYIKDVSPTNPNYADKIVQGIGSMAGFYIATVATFGGAVVPTVLESLGESGAVYEENKKKGMSVEKAFEGSSKTFTSNLVWNAFLNKFSGLFEGIDKPALATVKEKVIKTVQGGSFEGIQEAGQQLISNINTGKKDIWDGVWESLGLGALIGSGSAVGEISTGKSQEIPTTEVTNAEVSASPTTSESVTAPVQTVQTVSTAAPVLNEAVQNVQKYIQTPEVKLTDNTIETLKNEKIGVEELKFNDSNQITLYRDGNVEAGKPNSFSLDKTAGQEAYTLNKDEIILNTNSNKLAELYNQAFDEQTAPGMIDALKKFNNLESEIIAIPTEVRKATIGEIQQSKQNPDLTAYENAVNSGDVAQAEKISQKYPGDKRFEIHRLLKKSETTPTKVVKEVVKPQPANKPVGTGEQKPSKFAKRLQEEFLASDPNRYEFDDKTASYNVLNLKDDAQKAADFIESNPEDAVAVSLGIKNAPQGQTTTSIAIATALKAEAEGNYSLFAEITNSNSLRLTRAGQEIVSVRGRFNNDSATNYIRRAIDAKMKALSSSLITDAEAGGRKLGYKERVINKVDKETERLKKRLSKDQVKIRDAQAIIDAMRC